MGFIAYVRPRVSVMGDPPYICEDEPKPRHNQVAHVLTPEPSWGQVWVTPRRCHLIYSFGFVRTWQIGSSVSMLCNHWDNLTEWCWVTEHHTSLNEKHPWPTDHSNTTAGGAGMNHHNGGPFKGPHIWPNLRMYIAVQALLRSRARISRMECQDW